MNTVKRGSVVWLAVAALLVLPLNALGAPTTRSDLNVPLDATGNTLAFEDVITLTSWLLDVFWDAVFREEGLSYAPPDAFYWYNEAVQTACGPTVPGNAFYCPPDRSIWYHRDFLLNMYNTLGDYAAAHVLAHEWGHLVQHLLGISTQPFTMFTELQADCFAGVFARFAGEAGYLDTDDIEEAVVLIYQVADPEGTPWFEPGAHGDAEQRTTAYVLGIEFGLQACGMDVIERVAQLAERVAQLSERVAQLERVAQPAEPALPLAQPTLSVRPWGQGGLDIQAPFGAQSVTLEVFDAGGRRVFEETSHSGTLRFRALNFGGQPLANGVYFYVTTVRTHDGGVQRAPVGKLVVLR